MKPARPAYTFLMVLALLTACGDSNALEEACENNDDCAEGEFCATGFCPGDFSLGECTERPDPEECEDEADLTVCGCDGITYRNPCLASAEGVRLQIQLGCPCEGISDCADGQVCFQDDENDVARCGFL